MVREWLSKEASDLARRLFLCFVMTPRRGRLVRESHRMRARQSPPRLLWSDTPWPEAGVVVVVHSSTPRAVAVAGTEN